MYVNNLNCVPFIYTNHHWFCGLTEPCVSSHWDRFLVQHSQWNTRPTIGADDLLLSFFHTTWAYTLPPGWCSHTWQSDWHEFTCLVLMCHSTPINQAVTTVELWRGPHGFNEVPLIYAYAQMTHVHYVQLQNIRTCAYRPIGHTP